MSTENLKANAVAEKEKDAPGPSPEPASVGSPIPAAGLTVGAADDPAEASADAMADRALARLRRSVEGPGAEQHQHGLGCEHVRRTPRAAGGSVVGLAGGALDEGTTGAINGRRGQGSALPGPVLGRMETAFGRSFGDVRIHTDSAAAGLNRSVSAAAFTTGKDIFFGAGQFQPDNPAGEHVLAHELAHVVQGESTVQRWPWTKDDPATIAKKESDKLKEKEAKEQKKQDKEQDKIQAAKMKGDEKAHKTLEKDTATAQKADRVTGMKTRSEMSTGLATEQKAGKNDKTKAVYAEFAAALESEKTLFAELSLQMDEDKARDLAYKQIWLTNASPELKAVRPPRETASERLTSAVRKERTENAVSSRSEEDGKLGSMLSKKVERVYEAAEIEYDRLVANGKTPGEKAMRAVVERYIWDKAPEEVRSQRPTQPAVEMQARADARKRLKLRPTPPPKVVDGLETGIAVGETAEAVAPGVGMAGKVASFGLKQAGKPKDKALGVAAGLTPDAEGSIMEKTPGPLGSLIKKSREAKDQVAKGERSKAEDKSPKSDETKAAEGIGAVTGIISGLIGTVSNIMKAAKAISTAHETKSPRNILAATKAATDAVKAAAETAKSASTFATVLNSGVVDAVASFVPGLNIGIAALGLISNGSTLADMSMRMNDVNNSVFDARTRGKGKAGEPDVLVYPLLKMEATYTKKVEMAAWDTGVSVSELSTSIATVASAGGFGIPTAVQAGVKLLDLLHKLGHFIADDVLARIVDKTRDEATGKLEGSAENQLKKDPAMAVDALVMSAKKGDPIAVKFLAGYGIDETQLKDGKMMVIRTQVLKEVGEEADPLTAYKKFKSVTGSIAGAVKGVGEKWSQAGAMASDRNEVNSKGKSDRGFGWKLKMMFKGDEKFKRSLKKTGTYAKAKPVLGPVEKPIGCYIGTLALPTEPTDQEIDGFLSFVDKMALAELQKALTDKRNTGDEAQQILLRLVQEKIAQETSKAGAKQ
ncbi:DUF4157 domain-containing protein [Nakamurella silvestris]|nr:DUF4157 domain-containing protein [Nakamurella silvestris]